MDQLKKLLSSLNLRQRISIILAAAIVLGGLYGFTKWKHERDFRPLFTGLAAEDAGAIVAKLRETGVEFRISESGTAVLAPSARVPELRLELAGAGLPKSGRIGFELFDKTSFGVTDFAEKVNYRRAIEGEIERSVMALSEVEAARVHVTFPKDSVFVEARQPAKASVMVRIRAGRRLEGANVVALTHLVASAVEGLAPEAVSVVDMNGNLLSRPRRNLLDTEQSSEATLEYRQQVERDLIAKINATLEPLLGPEKFRAGVSVECDFSGGEQSEETFDPTRSVMTSSQKSEDASGGALASGVPGTASALPRPTSRPGSGSAGVSRRTENVTYQSSRVVRRVRLPQGTVKRVSAAVLVDHTLRWEGSGAKARRVIEPLPPERLKVIRDLVAAATGFSAERGDQLIVESLPFEATLTLQPPLPPAAPSKPPVAMGLPPWLEPLMQHGWVALAGAGGALLLVLLLFVWLLLRRGRRVRQSARAELAGAAAAAIESPSAVLEKAGKELEAHLAEQEAMKAKLEAEALRALKAPAATTKKTEVLTKHLVEASKKDPVAAAQILRSWLYDTESMR